VSMSIVRGLLMIDDNEKIAFLARKFGGRFGQLIQTIATDVSSSGINQGFQIKVVVEPLLVEVVYRRNWTLIAGDKKA
ncbi:hypothetical protein HAX54_041153, partial [Datura stramonium]|nr:hypothetical protein [Datura stramonium]